MKPLRQTRVDDYFPRADGPHIVRNRGGGFEDRPEDASQVGRLPATADEIPTRWRVVLSLQMQGCTNKEIADRMQLAEQSVSRIIHDERYNQYRESYLAGLDREFFEMKPLAFKAVRGALQSADENVALRASETWFKAAAFGGFSKEPPRDTSVTAEDVARKLLNINVQVNVNKD